MDKGIFNSKKIQTAVKYKVTIAIPNADNITLELSDALCPKTVQKVIKSLPFEVRANIWGKEVYTDPIQVDEGEENAKSVVELFDVAYWPPGKALCLFFGPTPLDKEKIVPYSPVNVIGKIKNPDKKTLPKMDGSMIIVRKSE